ncbi:hypothetical protein D3C78_20000 [compost metagenome]
MAVVLGQSAKGRYDAKTMEVSIKELVSNTVVVGKTGSGMGSFAVNVAKGLINGMMNGEKVGFSMIDPDGDYIRSIITFLPSELLHKVNIIRFTESNFTQSINALSISPNVLVNVIKDSSHFQWGNRMVHHLTQAILDIQKENGTNLMSVLALLKAQNKLDKHEMYSPVIDILESLFSNKHIRRVFGQNNESFNIKKIRDTGQIALYDLSGLDSRSKQFVGGILINLYRDQTQSIIPHILFCQEANQYVTESAEQIHIDCRKYNLGLVAAFRDLHSVRSSISTNLLSQAVKLVIFRSSLEDSTRFTKMLKGFSATDIQYLSSGQAIIQYIDKDGHVKEDVLQFEHVDNVDANKCDNLVLQKNRDYGASTEAVDAHLESLLQ